MPGRSPTTTPLSDTPPEAAPRAVGVREDRVWTRSPLISFGWTLRDYAKRVWDNSGEDNVLFLAGGIAFNILLAAVPFVLLLIWFLTFLLNKSSAGATEVVTHYLDRLVPTHEERPDSPYHLLLSQILSTHQKLPIWSSIGFIWFSTRLFGSLRTVLASVFDIENERSIIAGKIFDIEMTILSTVLITANTLISTYVLLATNNSVLLLEDLGIRHDVMGQAKAWGSHLAASILLATMFFAIYKYLPVRRVRAKTAWVAATFTTIAFELAKFLFTAYVGSFNPGSLYSGSIAAIVVLVIWVYYAALVFILGGEVGQVYELRRTRKRQREVFLN
jgi:membrane protein